MKLSELKYAIREMIVGELMEAERLYTEKPGSDPQGKLPNVAVFSDEQGKSQAVRSKYEPVREEEQLNEFAAFYKIKDDVDQEEAKAAIDKAIQDNPRQKNLQIALRILRDEEKVNFEKLAKALGVKSVATFNNQDSRKVLDGDLAPFISSSRLKKSEPLVPKEPEEPKEKGVPGRKKGSKKSDDSIAYTMGSDVKVVGKTPTKSFIKKAVKAAGLSKGKDSLTVKDLKALGLRDLDAIDSQIKDLNADLETKLARAKEIAAKGDTKKYTSEEAEFMNDLRSKSELRRRLKSTREDIIKKKIKKQDLNIDVVSTDED